jgi:Exodeoxyribonuclease VII large subunit (EC 3.1.11.6)
MQGELAAQSIITALDTIFGYDNFFDCVVIIRGGGAVADLSCFDNYDLAYHITQFPLPVLTGIGHEKDESIVDLVAHTKLKTPTAVAEFLIDGAAVFDAKLNELELQFTEMVEAIIAEEKLKLERWSTLLGPACT